MKYRVPVRAKVAKSETVIANPCSPSDLSADSLLYKLESAAKNCKITEYCKSYETLLVFKNHILKTLKRSETLVVVGNTACANPCPFYLL